MQAGQPGGHQTRQQKKDRADQAGFTGPQTCEFFHFGDSTEVLATFTFMRTQKISFIFKFVDSNPLLYKGRDDCWQTKTRIGLISEN